MRQIDAFVDAAYRQAGGSRREIEDAKAEMKNHLLEAAHELTQEGRSEQEAVELAIERFGGERELRAVVGQLFRAQRIFAKWLLWVAAACLILSSAVVAAYWSAAEENGRENFEIAHRIVGLLADRQEISGEAKARIEAWVRETGHISTVQIYRMSEVRRDYGDGGSDYRADIVQPAYQYDRNIWDSEWKDFYYDIGDGQQWFVHLRSRQFSTVFDIVLFGGIAVYAVLFALWATINAYHHRRLNWRWVAAFALLNVAGYLLYRMAGRRSSLYE